MTDEAEKEEVNPRDDGECREVKFERELRKRSMSRGTRRRMSESGWRPT